MTRSQMWAWLEANGYTESPEKVAEGKKAYKRMYHKEYYHKRKEERPRLKISFDQEEYEELKAASEAHIQPLAPFIKDSALAYLNQSFLLPDEGDLMYLRETLAFIGYDVKLLAERAEQLQEETLSKKYLYLAQWLTRIDQKVEIMMLNPQPA